MLKEILILMRRGDLSYSEIAMRLGYSIEQLRMKLDMLERMGYLTRRAFETGNCAGKACMICPSSSSCGTDRYERPLPSFYTLTDKGVRLAGR